MNITITITNPTVNVLAALAEAHAADNAEMMESLNKAATALDVLLDEVNKHKAQATPVEQINDLTPAQVEAAQYNLQDTALRIASVADIGNYLDIGTEVHWRGQKFVFDGVVEKINDGVVEDIDDVWDPDEKILFIRRNDTDKLVSLTLRDLQTGRLTLID